MRSTIRRILSRRLAITAVLCAGLASPIALADDVSLFSSTILAPNVLLMIDSSGSMNGMMYHKAWTGGGSATCDVITISSGTATLFDDVGRKVRARCAGSGCRLEVRNNATYYPDFVSTTTAGSTRSGYVERTFCGQTRKLYHDGNAEDRGSDSDYTRWFDPYVDWYWGLDPTDTVTTYGPDNQTAKEILDEVDDDANGVSYIDGSTFALYKRSRMTAAAQVAKEVMYRINASCPAFGGDCGSYNDNIRFGIAQFAPGSHGAYVKADVGSYAGAGSNKSALETAIDAIDASGTTPLGESLFKLYTYFMSRTDGERPLGQDGATEFPKYDYSILDGDGDAPAGEQTVDPVDLECRKNFIILLTDGEPSSDTFSTSSNDTDGFGSFGALVGDYAPDAAGDPDAPEGASPWIDSTGRGYLDDIALFMQEHDLRPVEYPSSLQKVDVYTIGFGTTGAAVDSLLAKTAANGNGIYRQANQSDVLIAALVESLSDIIEKTQAFTSATVPASRATDGNNFFTSYFLPSPSSPYWEGHLKLFDFNALGEVRDKPVAPATQGACALEDPLAPTRCQAGRLKLELNGFWDAAAEIPPAEGSGSRVLYVSNNATVLPSSVPSTPQSFTTGLSTTDLNFTGLGLSISDLAEFSVAGLTTGITSDTELKDAIIRYIRGCEFQSGTCVDRGPNRKLWDIFHANPVVVGPPNAGLSEPSYRTFVNTYKQRDRVIFAGSNGGFIHSFKVAEYGTTNVPDGFDRDIPDGGVELFGWMAYPARKTIADLPRTVDRKLYFMDGSPTAADVWLYPTATVNPIDVSTAPWNQWRTLLVGGMREGGRVVWALDVTNPNGVSGGPSDYPGYMWEFPCESTDAACLGTGVVPSGRVLADYMGDTWSEPVVTRIKATVNCSTGCVEYDRWVAIFGAGYDPLGDPNLPHNGSTTAGSRATDTPNDDYDASSDSGTSRAGRAVFMVDITTGEVLAMRRFDDSSTDGDPGMKYAFTATPSVFDLNFDGYADVAYFADLGGNVWKWVISDAAPDPINGTGSVEQRWDGTKGWKWFKVFTAESCTGTDGPTSVDGCSGTSGEPAPHFRSFFFPPQGAMVGARLWLVLGSGERNDLSFEGTLAAQRNRFYVFHDDDPLERELALPSSGSPRYTDDAGQIPAQFVDASSLPGTCTPPPAPAVGFYLNGEDGEKFITNSEIFFGVVLTGSYKPTAATNACDAGGDAFLYGFRLKCGEGIFPPASGDPNDPNERRIQIGDGLPNRPRVSVGPVDSDGQTGSCTDMVVVITSEGEAFSDCPGGRPDSGVGLKSWRDM